jgi:hypothetical protein
MGDHGDKLLTTEPRGRLFYPLPFPRSLVIGRCLRPWAGQRVKNAQSRTSASITRSVTSHLCQVIASSGPRDPPCLPVSA